MPYLDVHVPLCSFDPIQTYMRLFINVLTCITVVYFSAAFVLFRQGAHHLHVTLEPKIQTAAHVLLYSRLGAWCVCLCALRSLGTLSGLRRLDIYDTGGHNIKLTQQLLEVCCGLHSVCASLQVQHQACAPVCLEVCCVNLR